MNHLRSGTTEPGSIVRDDAATIDLRREPTRADLGFLPHRNERSYQRDAGAPAITTTVLLPTGTLRVPAFVITADAGDAATTQDATPHPPRQIVVQRVFRTAAEASRSLTGDAALLGLAPDDVNRLVTRVGGSLASPAPQQGVLDGLVRDWLAISVDVIGFDDRTVGVNYTFTVEEFHNAAVDRVVRDGVFPIDLTRRPSRAALAFRDTYAQARVRPAWNETLAVRLTLPGGEVRHPVTSVDSTATSGTGEPRSTAISLTPGTVADVRHALDVDTDTLGLEPTAVAAAFAHDVGTHVRTMLPGHGTAVYDVAVVLDATLGQPGRFAASLTYRFTYH